MSNTAKTIPPDLPPALALLLYSDNIVEYAVQAILKEMRKSNG